MSEDLWRPTIPCGHCGAAIRWELLDAHWCVHAHRYVGRYATKLRAHRDRKRAIHVAAERKKRRRREGR